jgi:membrane-bound lytic murein transglycosylase F
MYGSTSYFIFRDEVMGYDYELVTQLAKSMHVKLKITIANDEEELVKLLSERKIDLAAYNMIETKELKKHFSFVFPQSCSYQVLVQNSGANQISEIAELEGKTVYVKANSIFHKRLKSLNDEIGGKINIALAPDSITNEDLIDMVGNKKIEYTLTFRNTGLLYKTYHKGLDCHLQVGFNQHNGWLVSNNSPKLKAAIESWALQPVMEQTKARLFAKYWQKSPYFSLRNVSIPKGSISPYDALFKKYAPLINWDWRLLAAIAFQESRFDKSEVSWAGAAGLMQLMPRTAANFGLDRQTVFVPEMNIEAGVQYIKSLNLLFRKIEDKDERIKFILASYNSGPSHIFDAMALASKYGRDANTWFDNVAYFLDKENDPKYYQDPVVKYGKYRSNETLRYVENTLEIYDKYKAKKSQ